MAVRNESVRLSLDDAGFTSGMAKAAAATALLNKNLGDLDGTSVQTQRSINPLGEPNGPIARVGTSANSSSKEIDRLSGRFKILAQAAAVLGPAVVPLAAPGVGLLAGMTAQLGAVAGAIGVSVLAFNGMGDALGAINDYQLEPTAENLQAMRIEMERLGPAGAEFATFIDELGPQLKTLQLTAREGLLPGVEDGITNLLPLLPKVRNIIGDLAEAMGGLAGDAGADLAGPEWRSFFDYLDTEAGPLLVEFGNTVGNFAQGFAGLLVGLGPLTRDFSGGLEAMSESFANWSANLGSNDGFQEFLRYVQESGPKAVEFLGELAVTFGQILAAAAPVGDVILPVLTRLVDIIGDLAASPLGPLFFSAAAAMSVYSRGATIAEAATRRLGLAAVTTGAQVSRSSAFYKNAAVGAGALANNFGKVAATAGIVALSMSDVDDRMGLSNTATLALAGSFAGPWGAAAGAAVGVTMDLAAANDSLVDALERANAVMQDGTRAQQAQEYRNLKAQIDDTKKAQDEFWDIDTSVADNLKAVMGWLGNADEEAGASLMTLGLHMKRTGDYTDILAAQVGLTAQQFRVASGDAQAFSGALAQMSGWLDKREALRAYKEELEGFGKALQNGFQPKNVEGLDRVAAGILQVASQIKNVEVRKDFMANARKSLDEFAATGPKARAAVEKVIDKFVQLGLMKPKPKVDVDTKEADGKVAATGRKVDDLNKKKAAPKVSVPGASSAISTMDRLAAELSGLPREVVSNIRINTYRNTINTQSGPAYNAGGVPGSASGSTVPKDGGPYADRFPYMLAPGEEVISNRHGQADRHRSLLKAINAGALASGGTAGIDGLGGATTTGGGVNFVGFMDGVNTLADFLLFTTGDLRKELRERLRDAEKRARLAEKELDLGEKRLASERDILRDLVEARKSFAESVAQNFRTDVFGGGIDLKQAAMDGLLDKGFMDKVQAFVAANGSTGDRLSDNIDPYLASLSAEERTKLQVQAQSGTLVQDTKNATAFDRLLKQLTALGLDGGAYAELAASGNLVQAQAYASMSPEQIALFEQQYETRNAALQAVGGTAGDAQFRAAIREQTKEFREQRRETRELRDEARLARLSSERLEKRLERLENAAAITGPDRTVRGIDKALQGAVTHGQRSAT